MQSVASVSELVASKWGICEPPADAPIVSASRIEFILMPGVAFDRSGNRLGYGRGYYDKWLLTADPALARVAAAFSCQIVKKVPVGPHDQTIDSIITENEIINIHHER
jgi:5-formyltetrahydrofolate cyclo-ligase